MADDTIADRNAIRPPAREAVQPQPDGSYISQIGTTQDKFTDGFNGAALDPAKWDVVRQAGADLALAVVNGTLVVTLGVDPLNELLLVAKQDVTIPANLIVAMSISQPLAENDISFGFLEVDDNGTPVPHATLGPREFRNSVRKAFVGTTSTTTHRLETMSTNSPVLKAVNETAAASKASTLDHAIYARADDCSSSSQVSDSTANKGSGGARISTQCPSPNRVYRPFIHIRNATAPASATTVTIQRFVSIDLQELEVQASMGSGVAVASAGMPMLMIGGLAAGANLIGGAAIVHATGTTAYGGSTPTPHHKASTADTNLTLVKSTAGRLVGGLLRNRAAYDVTFKLYNRTSAPTAGLTPYVKVVVPAGGMINLTQMLGPQGWVFSSGIAYAITQLEGDTDATAVALGDLSVLLMYT